MSVVGASMVILQSVGGVIVLGGRVEPPLRPSGIVAVYGGLCDGLELSEGFLYSPGPYLLVSPERVGERPGHGAVAVLRVAVHGDCELNGEADIVQCEGSAVVVLVLVAAV